MLSKNITFYTSCESVHIYLTRIRVVFTLIMCDAGVTIISAKQIGMHTLKLALQ